MEYVGRFCLLDSKGACLLFVTLVDRLPGIGVVVLLYALAEGALFGDPAIVFLVLLLVLLPDKTLG